MVVPTGMYNKVENNCQPACLHREAVLEFTPEDFYADVKHRAVEQILEPLFIGKSRKMKHEHEKITHTFALVSSMIDDGGGKSPPCSDLSGYHLS